VVLLEKRGAQFGIDKKVNRGGAGEA